MIGKLLLAFIAISCVSAQISAHKVSSDTPNFQEVTSVYGDTWYSGYLELNSKTKVHYWFFPHDNTDGTSTIQPLLVTLNQGPGCSTIGMSAVYGFGPFVYSDGDYSFERNDYSWNLNANLLFIDAPGMGYSIGPEQKLTDSIVVEYYYDTLQVFLQNYKKMQEAKVYLHGVGFAGILVPRLALLIYNTNKSSSTSNIPIDIAGFISGNPVTVRNEIPYFNQKFPYNKYLFLRDQGFMNWDKWDAFTSACGYDNTDFSNADKEKCKKIVSEIEFMYDGLNLQDIMQDCKNYQETGSQYPPYTCHNHIAAEEFFNKEETKKALHVNSDFKGTYKVCAKINYETPNAIMYAYEELIMTGMRVWIYSGDQDAEVSFYGTLDWIQDLRQDQGLADLVPYGAWFYKDVLEAGLDSFVQNGGSYWKFDAMTFIRFKACGQNAARCNQIGSQLMFKNFILGENMPTDAFSFSD